MAEEKKQIPFLELETKIPEAYSDLQKKHNNLLTMQLVFL